MTHKDQLIAMLEAAFEPFDIKQGYIVCIGSARFIFNVDGSLKEIRRLR